MCAAKYTLVCTCTCACRIDFERERVTVEERGVGRWGEGESREYIQERSERLREGRQRRAGLWKGMERE